MSALVDRIGASEAAAAPAPHSRKNPFWAEVIGHERLTKPGSTKDTRHFILRLAGSGLNYTPGDSLGAFGQNPPALVEEVLSLLGLDPEIPIANGAAPKTLRETLRRDYTLNRANRKIISGIAERLATGEKRDQAATLLANKDKLAEYIDSRDYVDILREFAEARFESAEAFLSQLSPIIPRLYSIASAPGAHPGEVHLCIAVVRYETHGRSKKGLASGYFADHAGTFVKSVPVYVQEARNFRLPQDASRDVIMCGPGAGIAPFRAFLQHRISHGAAGRNWLFFGEQHRDHDFLYEDELMSWHRGGKLHRLDLAFSRDQAHKIYVQHRMRERARELWAWLQAGAYFYVCGDARQMARDVHQALIEIAQTEGGLAADAATEYVNVALMKTEKRYLRDVY